MSQRTNRAKSRAVRRGAMLLEVIVSLGLLVFGMSVVGIQINSALQAARSVDVDTRAMLLADTLLAELAGGMIRMDINDDEIKGNFLNQAPGYTWRIGIEQADVDNLYMLTIEIGYNEDQVEAQIEQPLLDTSIEDEGTKIVHTLYQLYPKPGDIDMERDYGLTTEDVASLMGGGESSGGSNSGSGESTGETSASADLTQLATELGVDLDLLAPLLEGGSFDPRDLSSLPDDQFTAIMSLLQAVFSQGGTALEEYESKK